MSVRTSIDILTKSIESSLILMSGESGTSKGEIMYRFIEDGLKKDESVLVVLLSNSSLDVLDALKNRSKESGAHSTTSSRTPIPKGP